MSKAKDVDEYLARVQQPARRNLKHIRATIRSVVPREATEAISYGIPAFKYKGSLVAYAAFADHCSFFPMSATLIRTKFKKELKGFDTATGTIRFPLDKPLPAVLVKKIVRARIAEKKRQSRR